jgi:hypothetical protein
MPALTMSNVVPLRGALYEAKQFSAQTAAGKFLASGTLCGCIDFAGPFNGTYALSPDEVLSLIVALQNAREDVLRNSRPLSDPRLVDAGDAHGT